MNALSVTTVDPLHIKVLMGNELLCEIKDSRIIHCLCRRGGETIVAETYPLPLYWHQYTHNDDPEWCTRSNPLMAVRETSEKHVRIAHSGSNRSGSVHSDTVLTILHEPERDGFRYLIESTLRVHEGCTWPVEPNPYHGEIEFCNLWVRDSFVPEGTRRKRFRACYVERNGSVSIIPHHHLESKDKHNIEMRPGDRLFWGIEDDNPVITYTAGAPILGGICAYMWDAHLGYRMHSALRRITGPSEFSAAYQLSAMDRPEAERLVNKAQFSAQASVRDIPVFHDGINRFDMTLETYPDEVIEAWPWERQTNADAPVEEICRYDRNTGYDDPYSLAIIHVEDCASAWKFTCLGPAYGQPAFHEGMRYHLSAFARVKGHTGRVRLALRLHREGQGSVFDLDAYELYASEWRTPEPDIWKVFTVWTPAIAPAPDRVHLLLEYQGEGICWFDNVLFDTIS